MEGQRFGAGYNLALTVDKSSTEIQDDVCKRTSFYIFQGFSHREPSRHNFSYATFL